MYYVVSCNELVNFTYIISPIELLKKGQALSTVFKTSAKYGYQAATVGPKSAEVLQGYRDSIRPV